MVVAKHEFVALQKELNVIIAQLEARIAALETKPAPRKKADAKQEAE